MKKSKGFTLVELLAVIVILAVLVLAATPAVSNIMQKSQKNSFKNEILGIVKTMSTAYTEKSSKKIEAKTTGLTGKTVYNVAGLKLYNSGSATAGYKYLCMSLDDLVEDQYMSKALGNTYGGYIQMWVAEDGKQYVYVNVTNSSFYFQGYESDISKSDFLPSITAATGVTTPAGAASAGAKGTQCPNNATMPAQTAMNAK